MSACRWMRVSRLPATHKVSAVLRTWLLGKALPAPCACSGWCCCGGGWCRWGSCCGGCGGGAPGCSCPPPSGPPAAKALWYASSRLLARRAPAVVELATPRWVGQAAEAVAQGEARGQVLLAGEAAGLLSLRARAAQQHAGVAQAQPAARAQGAGAAPEALPRQALRDVLRQAGQAHLPAARQGQRCHLLQQVPRQPC